MSERITRLSMSAFRGVPEDLPIDLHDGASVVVFGDNATGKSTITDAIEWYFTGAIGHLTKEGRQDAVRHAGADSGRETRVEIETVTGALAGHITMSEPSPAAAREAGTGETFLLRGRTLADFMDKTKGEKWEALAELLGLDPVDSLRRDLQHARNALQRAAETEASKLREQAEALRQAEVDPEVDVIVATIRELCAQAEIIPPDSLEEALDPEWRQREVDRDGATQRLAKLAALRDQVAALEPLDDLTPAEEWNTFTDSEDAAAEPRLLLFDGAQKLVDRDEDLDRCPLCGQDVDPGDLRQRISSTLEALRSASEELEEARRSVGAFVETVRRSRDRRGELRAEAEQLGVELPELPDPVADELTERVDELRSLDLETLDSHREKLADWYEVAKETVEEAAPPPGSAQQEALIRLGGLIALTASWQAQQHRTTRAAAAGDVAEGVYEAFEERQREHVDGVLERISARVAEIYDRLHPEEGLGGVAIGRWRDTGVELAVDFHGETHQPPHRVLSESHLNSLGVALFLAMADTFNERFGFLVLDDVVSSFDIEHRGRLAELLAVDYEDTQLIVLSHDHEFCISLKRRASGWRSMEFVGWSYEQGPRTGRSRMLPLIDHARRALDDGDLIGAAQKARRALEDFLLEACTSLEARLPFRRGAANEQRDATELLKGFRRALKDHARPLRDELKLALDGIEADLQAVLNVETHEGRGRASRTELQDAIERIDRLRARCSCEDCGKRMWHTGDPRSARCRCGRVTFPPTSNDNS